MNSKIKYCFRVDLPVDVETAVIKTTVALQGEGFGVVSHMDVQDTFKRKLDVEFRRYHVLGACNPPLAHQALLADEDVGLLLSCNIIVAELDNGTTRVAAINPMDVFTDSNSLRMRTVAEDVGSKLRRALQSVEDHLSRKKEPLG